MPPKQKSACRKNNQKKNEFAVKIIRELFRNINSKELSLSDRNASEHNDPSLTYGEVVPHSFIQILEFASSKPNSTFVDLGCGSGVALFTAALSSTSSNFKLIWGIEILPQLWQAACGLKDKLFELREVAIASAGITSKKMALAETTPLGMGGSDLLDHAISICSKAENVGSFLAIEDVVSEICTVIGHKEYRKKLKGHKTFKKLLLTMPDRFKIEGDSVTLKDRLDGIEEDYLQIDEYEGRNIDQEVSGEFGNGENAVGVSVCSTINSPDEVMLNQSLQGNIVDISSEKPPLTDKEDGKEARISSAIVSLLHTEGGRDCLDGLIPPVTIEKGDIFMIDWWTTADIVYCASLLFSDDMMLLLSERAARMKSQAVFITLKPLVDVYASRYILISDSFYKMSWQMARVYIYRIV